MRVIFYFLDANTQSKTASRPEHMNITEFWVLLLLCQAFTAANLRWCYWVFIVLSVFSAVRKRKTYKHSQLYISGEQGTNGMLTNRYHHSFLLLSNTCRLNKKPNVSTERILDISFDHSINQKQPENKTNSINQVLDYIWTNPLEIIQNRIKI